MIHRIEINSTVLDTRALVRKNKLQNFGFKEKIKEVFLTDVYTIDKNLSDSQLIRVASSLTNPVFQEANVNKSASPKTFTWAVETGFLPGVTDNVANTAKEIIEDLLKIKFSQTEGVYTSQLMFVYGSISPNDIRQIADNLVNPVIQRVKIKSFIDFKKDNGMDKSAPKVFIGKKPQVATVNLNISDEELIKIGKLGILNKDGGRSGPLALDLIYMKAIQKYFKQHKRNPTDIELESIAQTWSEHCKHTIFRDPIDNLTKGLFHTFIKAATEKIRKKKGIKDFCVSVFTDNSGAVNFNAKYLVTHKIETHNSPSALDPFGGSITGIVGVNRDAIGFGMGAKPIVNTYGFCFAHPEGDEPLYRDAKLTVKKLSARRIMDGVIEGVSSGGNCSGIPTPQGFTYFDNRYNGKPLVFVGTVGLIPKKIKNKVSFDKKAIPGDYIVVVGGRVGLDGIHGATFSSEASNPGSPVTAVQIGDPITQKKLSDAITKEARDLSLYHSITDNGAGGLSCSVAEMAKESGGCEIYLEKVPLKYPGLENWQIWISESQERMTLSVPPEKWKKFSSLMTSRGVEATIIGKFTNSRKCIVKYQNKKVMDIEMEFLHDGLPPRPMKTVPLAINLKEPKIPLIKDLTKTYEKMISRLNIAGFEFISQQYDHEVQGGSVLKPLQGKGRVNSSTTVTKPVLSESKGIILSQGINPSYSDIDTYHMAACAIDTAIRNAVATGADLDRLALLDNFCWCSSNDPVRLWQLKKAVAACYDYSLAFQTPFISGKDSMFNDFSGFDKNGVPIKISIPPTLLVSAIGVVDDISKTISIDLKLPGDLIYLLGETNNELGGSEYYALYQAVGKNVPQVNAEKNYLIYRSFYDCVKKGIIASAISVDRGGLGIALAKRVIAGQLGVEISLKKLPGKADRDDVRLFAESQGRIIISIAPDKQIIFEKTMNGTVFTKIGKVTGNQAIIIKNSQGKIVIDLDLEKATKNYKKIFKNY